MINRAFQGGRRDIFTLDNTKIEKFLPEIKTDNTKLEWDLFRLLQSEDYVEACSSCESWSKSAYYCTCKFPHTCPKVIAIFSLFKEQGNEYGGN